LTKPFENIAVFIGSESRFLMMAIIRELIDRHGSKVHVYCSGPQEMDFYQRQNKDGLFASVNDENQLFGAVPSETLDEKVVFEKAQAFEAKTGYTINRMVVTHRHLGRGYLLGGSNHMRSRQSEQTTYPEMVDVICRELSFWENEFSDKNITLCINGGRCAAYIARARNIPYRSIAGSRIQNLHYWAWNEMYETPAFENSWKQMESTPENDLSEAYYGHQVNREIYKKSFGLSMLIRRSVRTIVQNVYWRIRGYQKAYNYYFRDRLLYNYRMWRDYRRLTRIASTTLADIEDKKFAYFPLHIEPEMALHGLSPEYFYQHAAIAALSRDLPAGTYLAVKEHFGAIGRRPNSFYRQIKDLKNVIWLKTWESGIECAQKAQAVATISGTAGLEALIAGKPVITFGHHNLYNFLPSVSVVEDERNLKGYLEDALSGKIDASATRSDARKLLEAIEINSFDLRQYNYIDLMNFDPKSVTDACDALQSTLRNLENGNFAAV
jgi:hypothetical protein